MATDWERSGLYDAVSSSYDLSWHEHYLKVLRSFQHVQHNQERYLEREKSLDAREQEIKARERVLAAKEASIEAQIRR
jgi:hypothetical protein